MNATTCVRTPLMCYEERQQMALRNVHSNKHALIIRQSNVVSFIETNIALVMKRETFCSLEIVM